MKLPAAFDIALPCTLDVRSVVTSTPNVIFIASKPCNIGY
jgi:hypothetical protein